MIRNSKFWIVILLLLLCTPAQAIRVGRPPVFSLPWNQDQINKLNDYLLSLWNIQNGEFNFDIVTTTKTGANNGDIWIIYTAPVARIQYKAQGHIYTITPDGY